MVWTPTVSRAPLDVPDRIILCVAVRGPYSSVEQLKGADPSSEAMPERCPQSGVEYALVASAIETDNATAATRESIVLVPSTIPAGFYDVVTMSLTRGRISSTTVTSRHVIQIGPGR